MKKDWGIIGLGVMGKSLSLNFAEKGFSLALYNRHIKGQEENVATDFILSDPLLHASVGFEDLTQFVKNLSAPRRIQLMVNAGKVVDEVISQLVPLLDKGDIIIDGGNSHYQDTRRRTKALSEKGIHFMGIGISGGEEGARKGPSIMPGGAFEAYTSVAPMLEAIAARDVNGGSCCMYIGPEGAGHFVKMVHNGIEYAEMQLIAEICHLALTGLGVASEELADHWEAWSTSSNRSYLSDITIDILRYREKGQPIIDTILDQAGSKGTGSWTTIAASEYGFPATMIAAALFARYTSSFLDDRKRYAKSYKKSPAKSDAKIKLEKIFKAYHVARWINHHQGFELLRCSAKSLQWTLNLSEIARIWTNGCIIRSGLMLECQQLLKDDVALMDTSMAKAEIMTSHKALKQLNIYAIKKNIAIPAHSAALNYLQSMAEDRSSAYIIQAQRDYFGAHTYKRVDDPTGKAHHTIWN